MSDFRSGFASDLSNMIELKVSLGGSANTYLPRAAAFGAFCFATHWELYCKADHPPAHREVSLE